MTDAEKILWYKLRAHHFHGFKFRRQVPLGPYIVDFCCLEKNLIIEVDGSGHAVQKTADETRDIYFAMHHFRVLRFWNSLIFENLDGVLESIAIALGMDR